MYVVYDAVKPDDFLYAATLDDVNSIIEYNRKKFVQTYGWNYVSVYDNRVRWSRHVTYIIRMGWPFVALSALVGAVAALI